MLVYVPRCTAYAPVHALKSIIVRGCRAVFSLLFRLRWVTIKKKWRDLRAQGMPLGTTRVHLLEGFQFRLKMDFGHVSSDHPLLPHAML